MVEIRRGPLPGLGGEASGSERLPWLEPVEDEDAGRYPDPGGYGGVIVTVIAVLIGITMITAAVVWFRHHRAATADIGGVIHAMPGPYKVKPPESGGLKTDQVGEVAAGTGAGEEINGVLDLNAVPEEPIIRRGKPVQAPQAAAPAPAAPPVAPLPRTVDAPPLPAPVPVAAKPEAPAIPPPPTGGGAIQLGAFSSEAKAKAAWKGLSTRFAFLHDMTMAVQPVTSGDATLYRLRASGGDVPGKLCARLKIAGETCAVVGD
ncbi:hypothetical protein FHS31_001517 [Sphingomonas vulcanisoli]|uniref:SPOR domain-containing protein n=1 Tax=Sphingomonas vulcanisoli TaxID=1658060 RepID=A0ABX0TQX1_9SPHN|nr:SPOR domain-containing protein [Sphingomonas vulcanisoli]NIJ07907.1 hypothetical protein [Sphingomonas vulcanisoli]